MSLYQRGKSWYYDFLYRGERYTGCIGPVSKTVAKEILAKKKAEAVEVATSYLRRNQAHTWRTSSKSISHTTRLIVGHVR
jgi:hypothetical protein